MTPTLNRTAPTPVPDTTFGSILCATSPGEAGIEAVRQAAVLAGEGASVRTVSFAPAHSPGAPHPVGGQIEALVRASAVATALGVHSELEIAEADAEERAMLERCGGHDLLVAPPTAAAFAALARSPVPVLVARRPPEGGAFPESILAGVDGTPGGHEAARVAARLGASHRAYVALVAAPEHDAAHQHSLQADEDAVRAVTGVLPIVLDEHGSPERAILAAAANIGATLIVLGSRPGSPAGSVSAAVARQAPCSVLVLRPGHAAGGN